MSYCNTIMGQMLKMFSRLEFQKTVKETKSEYHSRGFSSWNHFISMLFAQLAGYDSLRPIEAGLATQARKLYHLGMKPVHRSTLSYANEHRPHELFKMIFFKMLSKCQAVAPKHKFKFKNSLYSMDTTVFDLCLSLYNWAKFRATKGAVKLHVKLDHSGYLPSFAIMSKGTEQDLKTADQIPFNPGDVVIFDRGYSGFKWYRNLMNRGVYFVTRLSKRFDYKVIKHNSVGSLKYIVSDQVIEFTSPKSKKVFPHKLRKIRSKDPETGKSITILTNNFKWSAQTISKVYKDRWQIELFFKSLKQQLKVKSFVGTSKNALLSQLWIALIAYLLLSFLKFRSKVKWTVYTLMSILPINLFSQRNLWDWINDPFHEKSRDPLQLKFAFF